MMNQSSNEGVEVESKKAKRIILRHTHRDEDERSSRGCRTDLQLRFYLRSALAKLLRTTCLPTTT